MIFFDCLCRTSCGYSRFILTIFSHQEAKLQQHLLFCSVNFLFWLICFEGEKRNWSLVNAITFKRHVEAAVESVCSTLFYFEGLPRVILLSITEIVKGVDWVSGKSLGSHQFRQSRGWEGRDEAEAINKHSPPIFMLMKYSKWFVKLEISWRSQSRDNELCHGLSLNDTAHGGSRQCK